MKKIIRSMLALILGLSILSISGIKTINEVEAKEAKLTRTISTPAGEFVTDYFFVETNGKITVNFSASDYIDQNTIDWLLYEMNWTSNGWELSESALESGTIEDAPSKSGTVDFTITKIPTAGINWTKKKPTNKAYFLLISFGCNETEKTIKTNVTYSRGISNTWFKDIQGWNYIKYNGDLAISEWYKSGGKWYYFDENGLMTTGWQKIKKKWYYLGTDGAMVTGWQKISGQWYYMNSSGVMQTGWVKVGTKYYYMNSSGVMQTNKWIGNYYVQSDGSMAVSKWIGNYHVNSSGKWDKSR